MMIVWFVGAAEVTGTNLTCSHIKDNGNGTHFRQTLNTGFYKKR